MRRLLKRIRKCLSGWSQLNADERQITLRILFWLIYVKISGRLIPFRFIAKMLGEQTLTKSIEPSEVQKNQLHLIMKVYTKLTRNIPISFTCLEKAFALVQLLKKEQLSYIVSFGVNKEIKQSISAHAWLQCGSLNLTGCEIKEDFKLITTFGTVFK